MEEIHYIGNVNNELEVEEYINNFLIEKKEEKQRNFLKIKIGKMKFGIFLIEGKKEDSEIKIIKSDNEINYGDIEVEGEKYSFDTDICFLIKYKKGKDYEFMVETLLEKVIKDMESYRGI